MENPMTRMGRRVVEVVQQELLYWIDALLKDSFNPTTMLQFIRGLGIDLSQLPGMVGQQPGFDPYKVLGLDSVATDDEVKKRYRVLVAKLHPDASGTEGTSFLFQMVVVAYELIKKERKWK